VSAEFSRWVGARGYAAIASRALVEVRSEHPALMNIRYELHSESGLSGVAESIERHGARSVARALGALLVAILGLCVRLIGDDIVTTLVAKSMENRTRDDGGRSTNLDQRSPLS
jgi:hypothetical protein